MVPKVIQRPLLGWQGAGWMCWMLTRNQSPFKVVKLKTEIRPRRLDNRHGLPANYAIQEETSWGLVSYELERIALDNLWIGWSSHAILVIHAFTPTKAKYNFPPSSYVCKSCVDHWSSANRAHSLEMNPKFCLRAKTLLVSRPPPRRRPMFMSTKPDIIAQRSCPSFTFEENGKFKQNALTIMVNRQL